MKIILDIPAEIAVAGVVLCWLGFVVIVVIGKRGAARNTSKRDNKSHLGFLVQGIAYAICVVFYRPCFSPLVPMPQFVEIILACFTIAVAFASTGLCYESARTLGKQWALVARVIERHELIMCGPYALIRNPIYLAMLGMLVATALAVSRWPAFVVAALVFAAGTAIRIHSEEKLLRGAFGSAFAEYAGRVPAFFPRLR